MKLHILTLAGILLIMFLNSCTPEAPGIEEGVSKKLAEQRHETFSNIVYNLHFDIPEQPENPIKANATLDFYLKKPTDYIVLDFKPGKTHIQSIRLNGKSTKGIIQKGHILIPSGKLENKKMHTVHIEFIAGDQSLNRNTNYMYTLFVPDRASTAFPCFDQPDMKATFHLELNIPSDWKAVTNGKLTEKQPKEEYVYLRFARTKPISTYLFAFTAGEYQTITRERLGKQITLYHRESDKDKLMRNIDQIFNLQFESLQWLEQYTNLDYPFQKYDLILIPSFQYSGMEHPGAVYYRESKMLLDKNASIRKELSRANLISHETAHMWFGDLVTMKWFNEVWLKEVFANFMADKMTRPQYPEVNHELNFLLNHYPSSYSIDRTEGANPIQQKLQNMKDAGTLYGAIIYHKAPIVMQKLEEMTGKEVLQNGLRNYLTDNQYATATWKDLMQILDTKTSQDLMSWSKTWVNEPGMPEYSIRQKTQKLYIEQYDPGEKGRIWIQQLTPRIIYDRQILTKSLLMDEKKELIAHPIPGDSYQHVLPNSKGLGYGYFKLGHASIEKLLQDLTTEQDELIRAVQWINLWENLLHANMNPKIFLNSLLEALQHETNDQVIELLTDYLNTTFWRVLDNKGRQKYAHKTEQILWNRIIHEQHPRKKKSIFDAYLAISTSEKAVSKLHSIWKKEKRIEKLNLSDKDFTNLAFELMLKNPGKMQSVYNIQMNQLQDRERKERFRFIARALSKEKRERDAFFESLKKSENRRKEPWVQTALEYLHHPMRAAESIQYIRPSLEILPEIQETGDIFFPKGWLEATLWGHNSKETEQIIRQFMEQNRQSENLRNKILQSSDMIFRTNAIKAKY